MKGATSILFASMLLVMPILVPVSAQLDQLPVDQFLDFDVETPQGTTTELQPAAGWSSSLRIVVKDTSRDAVGQQHQFIFDVSTDVDDPAWQVEVKPSRITVQPGSTAEVVIQFNAIPSAELSYYLAKVNVTLKPEQCCASRSISVDFLAHMQDANALGAKILDGKNAQEASPDDIVQYDVEFFNLGLEGRSYTVRVGDNPCGLEVTTTSFYLEGRERRVIPIQVQAPADKAFYFAETCSISIVAQSTDGGISKTVPMSLKVNGVYVDPGKIINFVIFIAIVGTIIWLILAAKRRTDEEILGKPQPPWTLPAEQLYLAELEKKDPQAAYVVRHFLMEDEYASSLLWYNAYKKATRGRRAMERKVLRLEHKFEKWDLKQQERLAIGDVSSERKVEKLQGKLDRKTSKAHRKELKAWKKSTSKLESKAADDHNKAMNAWKTDAKKAKKHGQPEPAKPKMPRVELAPEPEFEQILLDDHKWVAKKDKILTAGENAESKAGLDYEKERAKRLDKLRRKMEKMATKIDDPEFVAEHPLLTGA